MFINELIYCSNVPNIQIAQEFYWFVNRAPSWFVRIGAEDDRR